jgi:high-affinity nickel-transport protein
MNGEETKHEPGRLGKIALKYTSENSFVYKIFFGPDPNRVRPKVLLLLAGLVAVNIILWVVAVIIYKPYPSMIGTASLAYTLGLRHAVDAGKVYIDDVPFF